ncbi:hypothetical protein ACFVT5_14255 [Streptomyces sp. NPDC058001]|uniref:hypothetical protein n=1 Tax=Streptomyces sp. NPDC058001 TaxID=3346300 RepID=UPI0036EC772C
MLLIRRIATAVAAALLMFIGVAAAAAPSSAHSAAADRSAAGVAAYGSSGNSDRAGTLGTCTGNWCGEVNNHSGRPVIIGGGNQDEEHGWCWEDNAPRYGYLFDCINSMALAAGTESGDGEHFEDTDSFRVDAGCVMEYFVRGALLYDDRRGKLHSKWIKLTDFDTADIISYKCGEPSPKYSVDTFGTADGYQDGYCPNRVGARCNKDGELYAGTNYVFCKVWGEEVRSGDAYNHWWLLTDLDYVDDGRDGRAFVSALHLSRWGNDEAKDNSGREIPGCQ